MDTFVKFFFWWEIVSTACTLFYLVRDGEMWFGRGALALSLLVSAGFAFWAAALLWAR
jgi:hypothetical protein